VLVIATESAVYSRARVDYWTVPNENGPGCLGTRSTA